MGYYSQLTSYYSPVVGCRQHHIYRYCYADHPSEVPAIITKQLEEEGNLHITIHENPPYKIY